LTRQLAMPAVPDGDRVQLTWLNTPVELDAKLTEPVGVILAPTSVSVTLTVQAVSVLFVAGLGEQPTLVEVARLCTTTTVLAELVPWPESPR